MKTEAILQEFKQRPVSHGLDWLVITDGDTVLSVAKLMKLLNCYDPKKPIAIGQRYGFHKISGQEGFDYPTGGAGMIFSRAAVAKMDAGEFCVCPKPDWEDDMHVGQCLNAL